MSLSTAGGDALGLVGDEASLSVLPSMEGVLPIRGVDGNTGEAIPMDAAPGLREADDPFRADVVMWTALDVPSIMVEEDLTKLREAYRIPADIELMIPGPNERACFPRRRCTTLHLNAFVSGMRLPLHLMFQRILRAYGLAPTQVTPNGWSQMPRKLPKKKAREEEAGWYYFCPWGSHKPLVTGCPSSIKQWKESWFWVSGNWQRVHDDPEPDLDVSSFYGIANTLSRCELSKDVVDIVRSIYQAASLTRSYRLILNRHRCLVELRLMASKGIIVFFACFPLACVITNTCLLIQLRWIRGGVLDQHSPVYRSKGPRFWCPAEDTSQRKVIEDLSREGNRAEVTAPDVVEIEDTCVPEGEVPLKRKRKGGASGSGPSQSKKKVELVDNYIVCAPQPFQRTLSVNPSGEVVLDSPSQADPVSGGSGVGPFDSRKKLRELIEPPGSRISDDTLRNVPFFPSIGAQAVKKYLTPKWEEFASHGEREDVLEAGLAAAIRVTSLQMKVLGSFGLADLRESDSNILQLTKQLDNANAAQKVAKKRLLSESKSRNLEFQRLRGELEISEKGRTEAEAKVTRLLGEKKEMEAKLENVEADFIANFHNTEAYTNFSDYFARVGHQEVLAALRTERPDLDLGPLGDKFPPPDADEEEGS
ncbi:Uncharacterized protein Adt_45220 [Abeliophyllum distichum]|uniref:Transposase (putative) gypsy type domain-containing protein n=1 Tax=Abeliophyllum distichum TaxID=126358 RepID=A0ABD1PD54_9LAMI